MLKPIPKSELDKIKKEAELLPKYRSRSMYYDTYKHKDSPRPVHIKKSEKEIKEIDNFVKNIANEQNFIKKVDRFSIYDTGEEDKIAIDNYNEPKWFNKREQNLSAGTLIDVVLSDEDEVGMEEINFGISGDDWNRYFRLLDGRIIAITLKGEIKQLIKT